MSQSAESQRECRSYYKSIQRCVRCHKKDAYTMNGRSYCAECAEKERDRSKKRYEHDKERRSKRAKELKEERMSNGLCYRCGRPQDKEGRGLCKRCAAMKRETKRRNAPEDAITIQERIERSYDGFCYKCGKTTKKGLNQNFQSYRLCEKCWQDACKAAEKGRQSERQKYDMWGFWRNGCPTPRKDVSCE